LVTISHCFDLNPGSTKPLLVLAHANGFPPQTYLPVFEPLFPDFHVVSFLARPFWGDTPATWLRHWSQLTDDLLEGLAELGNGPVTVVGHSLGGVLSLYAAIRRPEFFSKLIFIDPTMLSPKLLWQIRLFRVFGFDARSYLVKGALRRRSHWATGEEAYQYFRGRQLFKNWSDGMVRAYSQNMTGPAPEGGVQLIYPPDWEAQIYRTIPTDIWGFAGQLKCPVLVIRGERSNTFTEASEKTFRKTLPTARFQVIPEAGHLVAQEKPLEVGDAIRNFLLQGA
jgi:pimeloyl-ACP methyl ester carboxylesterase